MDSERFIRKICHDLRAPIRAIKTLPEWLEADLLEVISNPPEHIQETLEMMKIQASRLDAMIVGLSELQRLSRQEENPWIHLSDLLAETDLPESLIIKADADGLPLEKEHAQAIIFHLVDNAYRHARHTDVTAVLSILKQGEFYEISVADDGPGIDEADAKSVYEPLTTLRPRDEVEGSRMGLAVIARLAELYRGDCHILPNPNGGTISRFRVMHI